MEKREKVILEVSVRRTVPPPRCVDRYRLVALDPAAAGRAAAGSRVPVRHHGEVPQYRRVPPSAKKCCPQPVRTAPKPCRQFIHPSLCRGLRLLPGVAVVAHVVGSLGTYSQTWLPCLLEAYVLLNGHYRAPRD